MKLVWKDDKEIGSYRLYLYDGDKQLDEINIVDCTCKFRREYDKELGVRRRFAYETYYCNGFVYDKGFDEDKGYKNNKDYGFVGVVTHTLEDVKRWCENYLAQLYLGNYYNTLNKINEMKRRAEWFEAQGFKLDSK